MIDTMFGSGSPMWMAPTFAAASAPTVAGLAGLTGAMPSPPQTLRPSVTAVQPPTTYGFGAGAMAPAPPGFTPSFGFGAPSAFATQLPVVIGPLGSEVIAGVTVPALLAAVAMRRGQPQGPTNDQEVEDFIYDTLELLPGAGDVEVRSEGGRTTLTGSVPHKRVKHDVGEIAWSIANVNDVQNNVTIASRRRSRPGAREAELSSTPASRKQA